MSRFVSLSLIATFACCALADLNNGSAQVVTVVVIFRHGDRVIIKPYPKDPYRNQSFWPAGWGQLTNVGKMEEYTLGQWLRNRYKDFLPEHYSEKDIYVKSTDVDRTLMSAEANLAGLYPPHDKQIWDTDVLWQPIPIHTAPETVDTLAMKKPCPKYNLFLDSLMKSPEIAELNRKNRDLYDYVAENTGNTIDDFESLEYVYNTLEIERRNNLSLPQWTDAIFPEKMKPVADFSFAIPCYDEKLARLKSGPFFHELLDNFFNISESVTKRKHYRKLWVYSGHDTTIANVLQTLQIFDVHSPPFASTILFELRHLDGKFFVNVFYKNSTETQRMVLKGCDFDCPLGDFVEYLKPVDLPEAKWDEECRLTLLSVLQMTDNAELTVAAVMIVICALILAIVVRVMYKRFRKSGAVYLRLPDDENV